MGYHGVDNPPKWVARLLVWACHHLLLGEDQFIHTAHCYLAGKTNGDFGTLSLLGIKPKNAWAVERDREAACILRDMRATLVQPFSLWTCELEKVLLKHPHLLSLFLDYCGCARSQEELTMLAGKLLPDNAVVSITHEKRQSGLSDAGAIAEHAHRLLSKTRAVRLVQLVEYQSVGGTRQHGSPMVACTFQLDNSNKGEPRLIDLRSKACRDPWMVAKEAIIKAGLSHRIGEFERNYLECKGA